MTAIAPHVQWMSASPLWASQTAADPGGMRRPTLLRFGSDNFMEDFARLLATDPGQIAGQVAKPETFRVRPLGAAAAPPPAQLKLYQPVQGHFNLVVATLVCRIPGLPDRTLNSAAEEAVGFVLRRRVPGGRELAWAVDGDGKKGWQPVPAGAEADLSPNEERLALFPMTFQRDGRRRRLFAGLVPTSSRETFRAGPLLSPVVVDAKVDPRIEEFEQRVAGMVEALQDPGVSMTAAQANEVSVFLLLDLADFLVTRVPGPWTDVVGGNATPSSTSPSAALATQLAGTPASNGRTWLQAMREVWRQHDAVTRGDPPNPALPFDLRPPHLDVTALRANVAAALGPYAPPADPPADVDVPKLDGRSDATYAIRCFFERPHCGPLKPVVVSGPSAPFALASFFDADAPARPIRISLPIDTSPAGLRGYQKNVGFVISNKLREQMSCVRDATAALKGDVTCNQSFDLGVLCSMSIPIITICALILLMIMVTLLNIVFWWLPFFRICLPINVKARA